MYRVGKQHSLVAKFPQLQYANFVLQARNAANETADGCMRNFAARCCGALKRVRMIAAMYVSSADLLSVHYAQEFCMVHRRLHRRPSATPTTTTKKKQHKTQNCCQNWALMRDKYGKFFCSDDTQQICKTPTPEHLKCCVLEDLIGNVGSSTHFPQDSCGKVPPKSTEEKLTMVPLTAKD